MKFNKTTLGAVLAGLAFASADALTAFDKESKQSIVKKLAGREVRTKGDKHRNKRHRWS